MTRQVTRMTNASRPSIPIEPTASIWAGIATRDCYLATSVNQPGDAVVHQVRSRGRKAPGKRQVESSAARKTHGASTGLTGLISGFGTKRPWRFRPMSASRQKQSFELWLSSITGSRRIRKNTRRLLDLLRALVGIAPGPFGAAKTARLHKERRLDSSHHKQL